jgi:hypothetical protein
MNVPPDNITLDFISPAYDVWIGNKDELLRILILSAREAKETIENRDNNQDNDYQ